MSNGSGNVAIYQATLRKMNQCGNRLRDLAKKITEVSKTLALEGEAWKRVRLSNGQQEVKSPINGSPVELAGWPDSDILRKAINEWNASLADAERVWGNMSEDDRIGLVNWKDYQASICK